MSQETEEQRRHRKEEQRRQQIWKAPSYSKRSLLEGELCKLRNICLGATQELMREMGRAYGLKETREADNELLTEVKMLEIDISRRIARMLTLKEELWRDELP